MMLEKQGKKLWKRIVYSRFSVLVLSVLLLLLGGAVWDLFGKYKDTQYNTSVALSGLEELQKRESELTEKIESLKTEQGVEAQIREKFMVAKDGEEVLVFIPPEEEEVLVFPEEKSWWDKVKDLL